MLLLFKTCNELDSYKGIKNKHDMIRKNIEENIYEPLTKQETRELEIIKKYWDYIKLYHSVIKVSDFFLRKPDGFQ